MNTRKNAQPRSPRSPRPVPRNIFKASNRLQAIALSGNPLQSIFPNGNRSQSRNNRLLTNVQEIKGNCKELRTELRRMQAVSDTKCRELKEQLSRLQWQSDAQCEELQKKLKKTDGKEIDHLKGLLKKCNREKEEKDKIIKKLNKDLEDCKREKEEKDETISRHESIIARYQTFKHIPSNPLHEHSEVKDFIEYLDKLKENVLKLYDFYHKKNRTSSYFKSNNMPKQNYITAIISKIEQKIEELKRRENR